MIVQTFLQINSAVLSISSLNQKGFRLLGFRLYFRVGSLYVARIRPWKMHNPHETDPLSLCSACHFQENVSMLFPVAKHLSSDPCLLLNRSHAFSISNTIDKRQFIINRVRLSLLFFTLHSCLLSRFQKLFTSLLILYIFKTAISRTLMCVKAKTAVL